MRVWHCLLQHRELEQLLWLPPRPSLQVPVLEAQRSAGRAQSCRAAPPGPRLLVKLLTDYRTEDIYEISR